MLTYQQRWSSKLATGEGRLIYLMDVSSKLSPARPSVPGRCILSATKIITCTCELSILCVSILCVCVLCV
eukprot:SAG31_NODE_2349_length_5893_cov_3.376251_5_plen_70_part_00